MNRTIEAVEYVLSRPAFRKSNVVVMIEGDYAPNVAESFYHRMKGPGVHFMYENKANPASPCVIKGRHGDMYQRVIATLMSRGNVVWGTDMFVPEGQTREECQDLMYSQMGRYKRVFKRRGDARFGGPASRGKWSAKNSQGGNDDLLTALVMLTYWASRFLAEDKYRPQRRGRGPMALPFVAATLREKGELPAGLEEAEDRDEAERERDALIRLAQQRRKRRREEEGDRPAQRRRF